MRGKIRKTARDHLLKLYRIRSSEVGGTSLTRAEFFPVDLRGLVEDLLGWDLVENDDLGYTRFGERIRGRCVHAEKRIFVITNIEEGEKNYSLAHEIGHAILHKRVEDCVGGVLYRKRSARRIQTMIADSKAKRREREAEIFASELLMPEKAVEDHFRDIFGLRGIWVGSSRARELVGDAFGYKLPEIRAVASKIAAYTEGVEQPSLQKQFGVSRAAMAIRLIELNLVY